jgi:CubicO group peptidase (beta-lactamase class C family)
LIIIFLFTNVLCFSQPDWSSKIDELFKNWNSKSTPGCALGIIKDNKVLYEKSYGMANLEINLPITSDTKFAIGSLSKQFTAFCIAILIHQNKVSLDDDIRLYLPEFPYTKDTIRIRHLVYHTNGLYDFTNMTRICGYTYDDVIDRQMIKEMIYSSNDLNFKPGDKFEYSNSGYFLLAEIVERISGSRIDEFVQKNIFGPLGMNSTYYFLKPVSVNSTIAVSYSQNVFGKYQSHALNIIPVGAGNIISTLHDLLIWEQNFYNDKLYDNKLKSLILREGILNNGKTTNYFFGLKRGKYKDYETIYHHGDINSYESVLLRIPEKNLSIIILSNDQMGKTFFDNYGMADIIANILLNKDSKSGVPDNIISPFISEEQIKLYVGTYKSKNGFTSIIYDDGQLKLSHSWGDWYYSIFPKSDTVFYDIYDFDYEYKFRKNEKSNIIGLWTVHTNYMEKINADSTLRFSDDYIGNYYCKELNTTYLLYNKDNKLYCKINSQTSYELIITGKDSFKYKQNILKLIRNDLNKVISLKINNQFNFCKL